MRDDGTTYGNNLRSIKIPHSLRDINILRKNLLCFSGGVRHDDDHASFEIGRLAFRGVLVLEHGAAGDDGAGFNEGFEAGFVRARKGVLLVGDYMCVYVWK